MPAQQEKLDIARKEPISIQITINIGQTAESIPAVESVKTPNGEGIYVRRVITQGNEKKIYFNFIPSNPEQPGKQYEVPLEDEDEEEVEKWKRLLKRDEGDDWDINEGIIILSVDENNIGYISWLPVSGQEKERIKPLKASLVNPGGTGYSDFTKCIKNKKAERRNNNLPDDAFQDCIECLSELAV